jgi:hypothetical protein
MILAEFFGICVISNFAHKVRLHCMACPGLWTGSTLEECLFWEFVCFAGTFMVVLYLKGHFFHFTINSITFYKILIYL